MAATPRAYFIQAKAGARMRRQKVNLNTRPESMAAKRSERAVKWKWKQISAKCEISLMVTLVCDACVCVCVYVCNLREG